MTKVKPEPYLKFVARLYELAADFDQHQLMEIRCIARNKNNRLVVNMASLFMDFRGDKEPRTDSRQKKQSAVYSEEAFFEVLSSKKVFPSNTALSEFAHSIIDFPVKPKESRNRLVSRILSTIRNGSSKERASFRRALEEHIIRQNGTFDFVSRWTKIIRDL